MCSVFTETTLPAFRFLNAFWQQISCFFFVLNGFKRLKQRKNEATFFLLPIRTFCRLNAKTMSKAGESCAPFTRRIEQIGR